jgi:hypothetical protein
MANFTVDADLTFYQPDILTFGIASFTSPNDYHAQARADIERDLRIRWFPIYSKETYRDISILNTTEMDATLLTDAQFKRALNIYIDTKGQEGKETLLLRAQMMQYNIKGSSISIIIAIINISIFLTSHLLPS